MISEAAVIAVAAVLYLVDCLVLLERGQALWSRDSLAFGSKHYQIGGRVVALLNPFTPFLPVFRTRPLFSSASKANASDARRALASIGPMALLQFALMFMALPFCLYRAPGWPFFMALVLAYANAIAMLGLLWWRLRAASIAVRPLIGLGFGWLVCLPLSVNAPRRAGLAVDVALDAHQAIRLLPERERERARNDFAAQIGEAMQELEEHDERHARLAELRRQLILETGDGRA